MAHHRHAALDQVFDGGRHRHAGLDLHRLGAGLLHDAHGVLIGELRRAFVGAEGHVDDHHGPLGAAHHRLAVQDHHLQRHADRVRQAVQHHADAVADQQQVAVRIQDLRHRGGVGGQADDRRLALT